jgi:hypothetical protein
MVFVSLFPAVSLADKGHRGAADGGAIMARHHAKEDAGAPLVLTQAQSEFRGELVAQQRLFVRDMSRADPAIEGEERQAIELHWRHVLSLLRVREFAAQESDADVLQKVDALRDQEDEAFAARMHELRGEPAPAQGAAR